MDETLQNAIDRRDSLLREIEAWDAFIASYTAQLHAREQANVSRARQADLFAPSPTNRAMRRHAVAAMMQEAEKLILEAAHPLTRFQLLEQLEKSGHHIAGSDRSKVLGTNLWRSKRFHNIQTAGYWPKSVPIPAPYDRLPLRETMLS